MVENSPIDPVCRMKVKEGEEAGKWEYSGTTYYFCSNSCLNRFQAEPEKYLDSSTPKTMARSYQRKQTETAILGVGGMHCAGCARTVEKALNRLPGVVFAQVNFATEEAVVEFDPKLTPVEKLKRAVAEAGYELRDLKEEETLAVAKELTRAKK
ncbi:MAG: cation transporter, partial [bacterium]